MVSRRDPSLHRAVAVVAVATSSVVLVAGLMLHTADGVVQVGLPAAVVLSGAALSQPLWAGALAYGLHAGGHQVADPHRSRLLAAAGTVLGGHLVGFGLVLTRSSALRPIGDGLYALATAFLLVLAGAVLVATPADPVG